MADSSSSSSKPPSCKRTKKPARYLNEDLVSALLSCLPTRSLIRLKFACKRWTAIASEPTFIASHTRHNRCIVAGLIIHTPLMDRTTGTMHTSCSIKGQPGSQILPDPSLSFIKHLVDQLYPRSTEPPAFRIWGSSNGLILAMFPRGEPLTIAVCNPTTMEYRLIPRPASISRILGAGIAFDPSKFNGYRVVLLGTIEDGAEKDDHGAEKDDHGDDDELFEFLMYSSETNTWGTRRYCSLSENSGNDDNPYDTAGVYWDGMVNWVTFGGALISFDVEQGQQRMEVASPASLMTFEADIVCFGESRRRLHLIFRHYTGKFDFMGQYDILEMAQNRLDWFVLYRFINIPDIPVCFLRGGEDEGDDDLLILSEPEKLVFHDLNNNTSRLLCAVPPVNLLQRDMEAIDVFPYAHTLHILNSAP